MSNPQILYQSILRKDGRPMVQIRWGTERGQLTPEETRDMALNLLEVAEAAVMDAAVFRWVQLEIGLSEEKAVASVGALRDYRGDSTRADWRGE